MPPPTTRAAWVARPSSTITDASDRTLPLKEQRRRLFLDTAAKVRDGKLSEAQATARLRAAGFPDKSIPWRPSTGSTTKVVQGIGNAVGFRPDTPTNRVAGGKLVGPSGGEPLRAGELPRSGG